MKALIVIVAGTVGMASAAHAESLVFSGRAGPTVGTYKQEATLRFVPLPAENGVTEQGQPFSIDADSGSEPSFGLQAGVSAAYGDFFADLAIEFQSPDVDNADLDRTDVLVSIGSLVGNHLSFFSGVRMGMQGDGAFNDDTFDELGLFIGAGIGGFSAGPFVLGASAAYNLSEAREFPQPGASFLYKGVSLKATAALQKFPAHMIQVRYQRFNGDDTSNIVVSEDLNGNNVQERYLLDRVELTESYLQLSYMYSFGL